MVGGIEFASMWSSMSSWCTPIVLFGVANLIIATLFIASKSNTKTTTKNHDHNHDHDHNHNHNHNHDHDHIHGVSFTPIVARVTSLLERAKSVNLSYIIPNIISTNKESQPAKYTSLSRLAQSIFFICDYDSQPDSKRYPSNKPKPNPSPSLLGRLKSIEFSSIYGDNKKCTESEEQTSNSPSQLARVPSFFDRVKSLKIVASLKKTSSEVRNAWDDKEEVRLQRPESARAKRNAADDAKAESFITKFREQLKLQRLDSLDRYNDMLRN